MANALISGSAQSIVRSTMDELRDRWVRRWQAARLAPEEEPGAERLPAPAVEVQAESTHLGLVVDEAVRRARQQMRLGSDPDYDLLAANFDVLHYLLQAPHLLDQPDTDVVEHFLEHGVAKRLSPHPDFSMVEHLRRYPWQATQENPYLAWLKHGRAAGDLADPSPNVRRMAHVLGLRRTETVDLVAERRRDLQQRFRTGRLGEMLARATEIEPLIGAAWPEVARPRLQPFSKAAVVDEVVALYRAQEAAAFRRARVVFVINRPRWGGGRRMEGHLAHALESDIKSDDIVVVYTDGSGEAPAGRYPEGVRQVDFAAMARDLPKDQAQHALVMLLRSFHADAVVNVNSKLLYQAMPTYGAALAATERLFLCFFCNEQTAMGTWVGWSLRYFYRSFDYVTGVLADSEYLAHELTKTYRVGRADGERLQVLRAPVDPELPVVAESPARPGRRPQVFWAGRWDRQKRIGLFFQVARLMPDVDFRMWGEPVMAGGECGPVPANVSVQGRYGHIREIPLDEADVWLYTAGWDGVPGQLLEVAMTGIPLVGSLVGGTGEVLGQEDSWPVAEDEAAEAYVAAIRSALADPAESRRRGLALRERMLRERTTSAFAAQATALLLSRDRESRNALG
jgi:glycosyltransferase involved in cell wall biosynthesis